MIRVDPVCGCVVDNEESEQRRLVASYSGETFSFCSDECKDKFEASPAMYSSCADELRTSDEEEDVDRAWE